MKAIKNITLIVLMLLSISCAKSNCYECDEVESGGIIVFEIQTICEGDNGWTEEDLEAEIERIEGLGSTCRKK